MPKRQKDSAAARGNITLFDTRLLREAEKVCEILIAVEPKQKDGVMVGVLNRLKKACTSVDIQH